MDTRRAKNAVIIMLILLNAVLFQLVGQKENAFTLSAARYDVILDVLKANRISLLTNITTSDFSPRSQLVMSWYNIDVLEAMLPGRLSVFQNGAFRIDVPRIEEPLYISEPDALQICDGFLAELAEKSGVDLQFTLVDTRRLAEGFRLLYMGNYDGIPIASNLAEFYVDGHGIYRLNFRLAVPEGFTDSTHMIYAKDEALLRFLRELRESYPDNVIHINDIKTVYYSTIDRNDEVSPARPSYMVTYNVTDFPDGPLRSYAFIDAFSNRVITNLITQNGLFGLGF
jgi:hypothetical protein